MSSLETRFAAALSMIDVCAQHAPSARHLGQGGPVLAQAACRDRRELLASWRCSTTDEQRSDLADRAESLARHYGFLCAVPRNGLVVSPGGIDKAADATNSYISSLGRDIQSQFCKPFAVAKDAAEAKFKTTHGREPHAGSKADYAEVWQSMGVTPDSAEADSMCFQGTFVREFRAFLDEWDRFYKKLSWFERLWGQSYDDVMAYRKRAIEWRDKFANLGGSPTAPAPAVPESGLIPWNKIMIVGGILAAVAIVPPVLNMLGGKRT